MENELLNITKTQIQESENETKEYLQEEASENISNLVLWKPKSDKIKQEMSEFVGRLK